MPRERAIRLNSEEQNEKKKSPWEHRSGYIGYLGTEFS